MSALPPCSAGAAFRRHARQALTLPSHHPPLLQVSRPPTKERWGAGCGGERSGYRGCLASLLRLMPEASQAGRRGDGAGRKGRGLLAIAESTLRSARRLLSNPAPDGRAISYPAAWPRQPSGPSVQHFQAQFFVKIPLRGWISAVRSQRVEAVRVIGMEFAARHCADPAWIRKLLSTN
jgi:hypothetical protein